jgi:hypothetical protein
VREAGDDLHGVIMIAVAANGADVVPSTGDHRVQAKRASWVSGLAKSR